MTEKKRSEETQFKPGHPKLGGRVKGARNKLSADFLSALSRIFDEHGEAAMRIAAIEEPMQFLKVIASVLPKEFEITDGRLKELSDEEIDAAIEFAQRALAERSSRAAGGKESTLN